MTGTEPVGLRPPGLPGRAPEPLQAFVGCRSTEVTLETGPVHWLPTPPVLGALAGKPTVTVRRAGQAGNVRLTLAWLFVSLDLVVSVVDGAVVVDTSGVPSVLGLREPIERWVRGFNSFAAAHGYALAPPEIEGRRVHLRKIPLAPREPLQA
jgi:hypothetical protein